MFLVKCVFDLVKKVNWTNVKLKLFRNLMDLIISGFSINIFVCCCFLTYAPIMKVHCTDSLPHPCMTVCSCFNYIY